MITDCMGLQAWDFSDAEPVFLQGALSLLKVIIPAAICLAQLKLYTATRRLRKRTPSILGLDELDRIGLEQ